VWKNEHRSFFFYQDIIQPTQQQKWFVDFYTRENGYMFVVSYENHKIGCLGFRLVDDHIDIYNVILGLKEYSGLGLMSQAMQVMSRFIISRHAQEKIRAKIIKGNPAIEWYKKNGFEIIETNEQYHLVQMIV
jgi:RimJ/RimL family protein N-acetyltransferase